ncbi:family 16 glycoside hydrolase [Halalkalibaculum sp. DA3122]|uniref:family 16 glycoside hydrolase n=1 Tax=Halalkalibaculum sp. DA3122 TaxID=3373607 RepID=UPI0037553E21
MSAFDENSNGWQIVGEVTANPLKNSFQTSDGEGILVGSAASSGDLRTKMKHGNISIEFDFLLSHKASAVIWLQGRYGIQLANVSNVKGSTFPLTSGSIIPVQSDKITGIGNLANMNVAHAPGIWQHIKIVFEAPQFDNNGKKTKNARIVSVENNGALIQQNKYLPGVSKNAETGKEASEGPIIFQINKGDIAIRNVNYMVSSGPKIKMRNITYKIYKEKFLDGDFFYNEREDEIISLPNLTSREPTNSGKLEWLGTGMLNDDKDDYAIVFQGELDVPISGEFKFKTVQNGVGAFQLNGKELFRWDAVNRKGKFYDNITLKKGTYPFKLTYFNFANPQVGIEVNGPGIIDQQLFKERETNIVSNTSPIIIKPTHESPLIQRSFTLFEGQKLLSGINVGYSEGIHYTFNLASGSLVKVWRGEFGNATPMWEGRGLQQVLEPIGSVLSLTADQQVLLSNSEDLQSIKKEHDKGIYQLEGYRLNKKGEPIFQYTVNKISINDHISLGSKGRTLTRSLRFGKTAETVQNQTVWYRIANASNIEQVTNNLYSLSDQSYYIEIDEGWAAKILETNNEKKLLVPIEISESPKTFTYSIIW